MFATQSVELPQPPYTALREYLKQQGRLGQVSSALGNCYFSGISAESAFIGCLAIGFGLLA